MRCTVSPWKAISQTLPAPAVMPHGLLSTAIRLTTRLVSRSIRTTSSVPKTAAHAEPAAVTTEQGCAPTLIFATTSTPAAEPWAPATSASEAAATRPTLRIHW
jgi:hypothetical protein